MKRLNIINTSILPKVIYKFIAIPSEIQMISAEMENLQNSYNHQ